MRRVFHTVLCAEGGTSGQQNGSMLVAAAVFQSVRVHSWIFDICIASDLLAPQTLVSLATPPNHKPETATNQERLMSTRSLHQTHLPGAREPHGIRAGQVGD